MRNLERELAQLLQRCAFPERAYASGFNPSPIYLTQAATIVENREVAAELLLLFRALFGGTKNA